MEDPLTCTKFQVPFQNQLWNKQTNFMTYQLPKIATSISAK